MQVVVVDPHADAAQQVDLQRWGASYLAGYGDSQDTLAAAGVADALAVLSGAGVPGSDLRARLRAMPEVQWATIGHLQA